jgi:hypothetical protein
MFAIPLTTELAERAERLRKGPVPPEIERLKKQIDNDTRLLGIVSAQTGVIDHDAIQAIVQAKLRLDGLYAKWLLEG